MKKVLFFLVCLYYASTLSFKIDRVILATDTHLMYMDFWPLVARMWEEIVGVKPTLAFIAPAGVFIDESLGDVIRFEPIPGVPTSLHAQVIRLLLPAYFPDDFCIISDIDMIPLSKNYFIESVQDASCDSFVIFRDQADSYYTENKRYPMCYNAAKGSIFAEIFDIKNTSDISTIIQQWYALEWGWHTDELILTQKTNQWNEKTGRLSKLGHPVTNRIDRSYWSYDINVLHNHGYIDSHLLRPYNEYQKEIDTLVSHITIVPDFSGTT